MTSVRAELGGSGADDREDLRRRRIRRLVILWIVGVFLVVVLASLAWLYSRVTTVRQEVARLPALVDDLSAAAAAGDAAGATAALGRMTEATSQARTASADPVWRAVEIVPLVGGNLTAVREAVGVADDLLEVVGEPFAALAGQAAGGLFLPGGQVDLAKLAVIQSTVSGATDDVTAVGARAADISTVGLVPEVGAAVGQLQDITGRAVALVTDADTASSLALPMMGASGPRTYLVLIMNNSEVRAQGGMPGFTAAVRVQDGRISLLDTASTTDFDPVPDAPLSATAPWEDALFSSDIARRLQDVTATYDFRDSARYATALASRIYGLPFDGVVAVDPYVLASVLKATGPATLADGSQLTSDNAVDSLLRDVYLRYPEPADQDAYFASVVDSLMGSLTRGAFQPVPLVESLSTSVDQGRVRLWSAVDAEQAMIDTTEVAGIPSTDDATIGVYANDWTRSKMDFYLASGTTVTDEGCTAGSRVATVTVDLRHTLTAEQAAALPAYVTGDGLRAPVGHIATQVVVVGPVGSVVSAMSGGETDAAVATVADGAGRPATTRIVTLAPGASSQVTVTFSWPDDSRPVSVQATPKLGVAAFSPSTRGCR